MDDNTLRAADGAHTTDGTPHGFTSLTPFLVVPRAADAIAFYVAVFGAREVGRVEGTGPDGTAVVTHAELDFGAGRLQLGDPNPEYGLVADARPEGASAGSVSHSIGLYCPDVDAVLARAVERGATVREPAVDFVSGDRFCSLLDPFGQRWSVMTRVEDISEAESARRVEAWAAAGYPPMDGA